MNKKRLFYVALFSAMLFMFSVFVKIEVVQANSGYSGVWFNEIQKNWDSYTATVEVEAGQKFNIADWASISTEKGYNLFDSDVQYSTAEKHYSKFKYSSSNKKVATVSKKGVVTTKKTGKTIIKIKKGKMKLTCHLKVVKKNSLHKLVKNSFKMKKQMNKVFKIHNGTVTDKNMINLTYAVIDAEELFKNQAQLTNGLYTKKTGYTNKMVLPEYCKYLKIKSDLEQYLCDNMYEDSDVEIMYIKKIVFTGKSKTGRALLSRKMTKYDVTARKMSYWDGKNYDLTYKGDTYKALKKKNCIREYEISRTNTTTGKIKSYTLKVYYTEGSNLAKVKSDVRIPAGEYELEQYVDAEHREVLKVVIE